MSKPVLSDSLFNAGDVATAILAEADLQVTNSDLGVTDITSAFVPSSANQVGTSINKCYKFNGFVFVNLYAVLTNITSGAHILFQINNSAYFPNASYYTNQISYQGDFSEYIEIKTNGDIRAVGVTPGSGSDVDHRMFINCWYRI